MSFDQSVCPPSREYQDVIDLAARRSFSPELLGDLDVLKNKHNCDISQSPSDAVDLAVKALHETDPSITYYRERDGRSIRMRAAGIGTSMELKDGDLKLTKLLPTSPAQAADLRPGDKITSIDGKQIGRSTTMDEVDGLIIATPSELDAKIGIGVKREGNGPVKISQVEPKSAAQAAGLMDGDAIIAIDGTLVSNKESLVDVNKRLEGRKDTNVHLLLERGGERVGINVPRTERDFPTATLTVERNGKPFEITVPRRPIEAPSVSVARASDELTPGGPSIPKNSMYIKINDLYDQKSTNAVWNALNETAQKDSSVILDLRDNVGGRADDAVLISSLFIKNGVVYRSNERVDSDPKRPKYTMDTATLDENNTTTHRTTGGAPIDDAKPATVTKDRTTPVFQPKELIVLVNENTSGSAELLAEALKVNADATVIGTETKGYGVTQTAHQVSRNTMLFIPDGHLLNSKGQWIGDGKTVRNGIAPDVRIQNPANAEFGTPADEQVKAAIKRIRDRNK